MTPTSALGLPKREDWLASAHRVGSGRIDHGAYLYLIDPQARAAARIEGVGEPAVLAERIRAAIADERG